MMLACSLAWSSEKAEQTQGAPSVQLVWMYRGPDCPGGSCSVSPPYAALSSLPTEPLWCPCSGCLRACSSLKTNTVPHLVQPMLTLRASALQKLSGVHLCSLHCAKMPPSHSIALLLPPAEGLWTIFLAPLQTLFVKRCHLQS